MPDNDIITTSKYSVKLLIKVLDNEIGWMKYIENTPASISRKNRNAAQTNRKNLDDIKNQLTEAL